MLSLSRTQTTGEIYGIRCIPNGRIYVGSAVDFDVRWYSHKYQLNNGKHFNPHLQSAWAKYGCDAFEFFVIERTKTSDLLARETIQIAAYRAADRKYGFNVNPTAQSRLGVPHTDETKMLMSQLKMGNKSRRGIAHTDATKAKMSLSQKGRTVSEERRRKISASLTGKTLSAETKAKLSAAHKCKAKPDGFAAGLASRKSLFSAAQALEIRRLFGSGMSFRKIAVMFGTSHNVVSKVVNGNGLFYSSFVGDESCA